MGAPVAVGCFEDFLYMMNAASFMELNRYSIVEVRLARMIPSIATNTTVSMDTDSGSFHIQLSVVEASAKDTLLLSKLFCTPKGAPIYVCVYMSTSLPLPLIKRSSTPTKTTKT